MPAGFGQTEREYEMEAENEALKIADSIAESAKRAADDLQRPDGSRQRAWTKALKALRHFAADRVDKLIERSFRRNVDDHADQRAVVDRRCEQSETDRGTQEWAT